MSGIPGHPYAHLKSLKSLPDISKISHTHEKKNYIAICGLAPSFIYIISCICELIPVSSSYDLRINSGVFLNLAVLIINFIYLINLLFYY